MRDNLLSELAQLRSGRRRCPDAKAAPFQGLPEKLLKMPGQAAERMRKFSTRFTPVTDQ
jgi:hypothetical protein